MDSGLLNRLITDTLTTDTLIVEVTDTSVLKIGTTQKYYQHFIIGMMESNLTPA